MAQPVVTVGTDYSRLTATLPERASQRDLRAAKRSAVQLFDEVGKKDFAWPKTAKVDAGAVFYLSKELDSSMLRVYNAAVKKIQATDEHLQNYRTLVGSDKNCGGFSVDTAILEDATSFEQMVALDQWIFDKGSSWQKGRRTLCLKQGDDEFVPVYIAKRKNAAATTMTTTLGTGRGTYKAPQYSDLTTSREVVRTSVFTKPLLNLEIVRQPYFSAATVVKTNAFETEIINEKRRYEITDPNDDKQSSQFACVELKGQNKPQNSPTKEKSAGANLISLVKKNPDKKINTPLKYETLSSEGYKDDAEISVTPKDLFGATKKAVCDQNTDDLDDLMTKLFICETQTFSSKIVADYYAGQVFNTEDDA